ncbi:MAG TPA: hypothetical protein VGR48_18260, partial [Terriglobales bacterium]|nr:hypothetical protein [Terriglobales bacterium]
VIRSLESIMQRKARLKYIAEQKGDVRHTSADTSKAKRMLGYEPQVSLQQGLEREAEWLQRSFLAAGVK